MIRLIVVLLLTSCASQHLSVGDTPNNTSIPVIHGDAVVGATLQADPGIWDAPADLTYQWLRCQQVDFCMVVSKSQHDASYLIDPADTGQLLRVMVKASNRVGYSVVTALPIGPVQP